MDANKLLTQRFSWEGLKRARSTHEIRIESIGRMVSRASDRVAGAGADPARRQGDPDRQLY